MTDRRRKLTFTLKTIIGIRRYSTYKSIESKGSVCRYAPTDRPTDTNERRTTDRIPSYFGPTVRPDRTAGRLTKESIETDDGLGERTNGPTDRRTDVGHARRHRRTHAGRHTVYRKALRHRSPLHAGTGRHSGIDSPSTPVCLRF